jgi:hypothetical protein
MVLSDLISYYQNLLIVQYNNKPKALAQIATLAGVGVFAQWSNELIVLSGVPASGSFYLTYQGNTTTQLQWNSPTSQIQNALNKLMGLGFCTVQGSLQTKNLSIAMIGVTPQASSVTITTSTLETSGSVAITSATNFTDINGNPTPGDPKNTLPQAIQSAFTLGNAGGAIAVGSRLDSIGKLQGVTRFGYNFSGPMTLDDDQFTVLILIAIIKNSATSDLNSIQNLLNTFFHGIINIFDHQDMRISYFFDASLGTQQLAEFFVKGGFLPKPMAVELSTVTYAPGILSTKFFGMRTMLIPPFNVSGMNTMTTDPNSEIVLLTMSDGIS